MSVVIEEEKKDGTKTSKLAQIIGYDKEVAQCRELLPANQVQNVGDDYDMSFKDFPHMLALFMFHLKKFESRPGYQCRNVTIGVAATIDSYSHLHTQYVLHQGLRKNEHGSWDVVPLQFVDMSNSPVPPNCAIRPIKPQTCVFNALTNMVEEMKDLIKIQSNLSSYKTASSPAVWSGFICELINLGDVQHNPPLIWPVSI